jgi:hypothetical protein
MGMKWDAMKWDDVGWGEAQGPTQYSTVHFSSVQ